ncbi:unnamed protein product [Moneuplotes crassus]|uniref:BZIP domain-containing protein n=1 Tax=Euplotes crassus TaxID=5936 RepID=A0AAD1U2U3_EUPCR|nr:unnamed protein product [Moneuplotes crassus]
METTSQIPTCSVLLVQEENKYPEDQTSFRPFEKTGDLSGKSNQSTVNSQMNEESENNEGNPSSTLCKKNINKRERRLMQNRESASRLRIKKKENMTHVMKEKEQLRLDNVTLQKKVDQSQQELFDTLQESIQLRKRINEIQKSQNDLLISFLSDTHQRGINHVKDTFQQENKPQSFIRIENKPLNPVQIPQLPLQTQEFDLNSVLSLLTACRKPIVPILSSPIKSNQVTNFSKAANNNTMVVNNGINQIPKPNTISRILNVLTQGQQKDELPTSIWNKN